MNNSLKRLRTVIARILLQVFASGMRLSLANDCMLSKVRFFVTLMTADSPRQVNGASVGIPAKKEKIVENFSPRIRTQRKRFIP